MPKPTIEEILDELKAIRKEQARQAKTCENLCEMFATVIADSLLGISFDDEKGEVKKGTWELRRREEGN